MIAAEARNGNDGIMIGVRIDGLSFMETVRKVKHVFGQDKRSLSLLNWSSDGGAEQSHAVSCHAGLIHRANQLGAGPQTTPVSKRSSMSAPCRPISIRIARVCSPTRGAGLSVACGCTPGTRGTDTGGRPG